MLRGETDALGFAAGERIGLAVEREVLDAHVEHEREARRYLFDDNPGNFLFFLRCPPLSAELPNPVLIDA